MGRKELVDRHGIAPKPARSGELANHGLSITDFAHKAAVVGDPPVPAVLAGLDVTAQRSGTTMLDRRHDLELMQAQMPGMGSPISRACVAEDIGDLE